MEALGKWKFGKIFGAVVTGGVSLLIPTAKGASVGAQIAAAPKPTTDPVAERQYAAQECLNKIAPMWFTVTGKLLDQDQAATAAFKARLTAGTAPVELECSKIQSELMKQIGPGEESIRKMAAGAIAMQKDYGEHMKQSAAALRACGVSNKEISDNLTNQTWRLAMLKKCATQPTPRQPVTRTPAVPKLVTGAPVVTSTGVPTVAKVAAFGVALAVVGGVGYMVLRKR